MAQHKKYSVEYASGATGYGWTAEHDRLDEFEDFINEMRYEYTASVSVYDYSLSKFVYYKRCLSYKPEIDMLHAFDRDMRTTTRKWK